MSDTFTIDKATIARIRAYIRKLEFVAQEKNEDVRAELVKEAAFYCGYHSRVLQDFSAVARDAVEAKAQTLTIPELGLRFEEWPPVARDP